VKLGGRFALNEATTGPADLQKDVHAAAEAGYDGIELRDTKIEAFLHNGGSLETVRRELEELGLAAVSINALEDATLAERAAWKRVVGRCEVLCRWAAAVGAPYLVVVPSPMREGLDAEEVQWRTAVALGTLAEIARPFGVRIAFEFLGFPDCSIRTLQSAWDAVAACGDASVGLVLDAFHFYVGGSTWEMLEAVDVTRLLLVHLDDAEDRPRQMLTDAHRLLPGLGVIPLRELVRRIETKGFSGFYSLELFRPEYWRWDPVLLARKGLEHMRRLFEEGTEAISAP
jgi:2-keto-myo-inositol isomerase